MSVVLKFGGSSVADATCVRRVAEIVKSAGSRSPLVVLSAMGKTTDALFAAAQAAERGETEVALKALREIVTKHKKACVELWEGEPPIDLQQFIEALSTQIDMLLRGVSLEIDVYGAASELASLYEASKGQGEPAQAEALARAVAKLGFPQPSQLMAARFVEALAARVKELAGKTLAAGPTAEGVGGHCSR